VLNLSPGAMLLGFFVDIIIRAWAFVVIYEMWKASREIKEFRRELDAKEDV